MPGKKSKTHEILERLGLELYLLRGLRSNVEKRDKEVAGAVKGILLEELGTRSYEGERVEISCREKSKPQEVDPQVAGRYVPVDDFLGMVRVDKKKFEAYLETHEIELEPKDYLVSPGTYDVVDKPKIKLPMSTIRTQFKNIYSMLEQMVFSKKKK